MDPLRNPFSPGAGSEPPELAGRDEELERASIALRRIALGRAARSFIFYGLRGTGKTVLLRTLWREAEEAGMKALWVEAQEGRTLAAMLAGPLRRLLLQLDRAEQARAGVQKALRVLASFVHVKLRIEDIGLTLDVEPEKGMADSGDLELDLTDLLQAVGQAARERRTAIVLFMDEIQYLGQQEGAALVAALHATVQAGLPVTMVGAGLPQLLRRLGQAKSYAERLFEFAEVSRLDHGAAWNAIVRPIEREEEAIVPEAVHEIIRLTERYPYFLQEWGKHAWNLAFCSPITLRDVENAAIMAVAELDGGFFRVRFDRMTPAERRYIRAAAELGAGPHRTGEVADILGRRTNQVAPVRQNLVRKGILYAPAHGDTAFTVPMFDSYIRRVLPEIPGWKRPKIKLLG